MAFAIDPLLPASGVFIGHNVFEIPVEALDVAAPQAPVPEPLKTKYEGEPLARAQTLYPLAYFI